MSVIRFESRDFLLFDEALWFESPISECIFLKGEFSPVDVPAHGSFHSNLPVEEDFASSKLIKVRFHEQQTTRTGHFSGLTRI